MSEGTRRYEFEAKPNMALRVGLTPNGVTRDGRERWLADVYLDSQLAFEGLNCIGPTQEEAIKELLLRLRLDGTPVVT